MASEKPDFKKAAIFAGMAAIGSAVVPAITGKATRKSTKAKVKAASAKIDFENMGPEIVRKDKENGDEQ